MKRNNNQLFKTNELSDNTKVSMKKRIIFAVLFAIPLLLSIFLGDWLYLVFVTVILFFAIHEILGVVSHRTIRAYFMFFISLALIVYWPIFQGIFFQGTKTWHLYEYFGTLCLPLIILVSGMFLLFFLVVIDRKVTVRDACFLITMGIMIALGLQSMLFLRYYPLYDIYNSGEMIIDPPFGFDYTNTVQTSLLLFYVFIATFATDIGAYFVGVLFGKNKMNERISPNKTWEGFVGGIVFSFIFSFTFGMLLAFNNNPIMEVMNSKYWYNILILSLILPFFATLGDFVFSSIKRYYGIKDYGKIIPGHGGVLDRFDSLIFVFIVAALYIIIFTRAINGENPLV